MRHKLFNTYFTLVFLNVYEQVTTELGCGIHKKIDQFSEFNRSNRNLNTHEYRHHYRNSFVVPQKSVQINEFNLQSCMHCNYKIIPYEIFELRISNLNITQASKEWKRKTICLLTIA